MESPIAGMPPANELTAGILADAHQRAREIDDETATNLDRIRGETDRQQSDLREKLHADAKRRQEEAYRQAQAKQELDAVQQKLTEKQRLIGESFAGARKELERMSADRRKRLIAALWARASSQIRIAAVVTCKKDAAFFKGKCRITVNDCIGGFRAISFDGKVSVDMRFESLLEDLKARKAPEIAAILFAEQKRASRRMPTPKTAAKRRKK